MIQKISMRDIAAMSQEAAHNRFHEDTNMYHVEFDDGVLAHNGCEINYMRILLNYWNKLPIQKFMLKKYSLAFKQEFTPNTSIRLCSLMMEDYVNHYQYTDNDIDDNYMGRVLYKDVVNEVYNFYVRHLIKYTAGGTSFDLIRLVKHPRIKAANDKVKKAGLRATPKMISACHDEITDVLENDPALAGNPWVVAFRTSSIKKQQFLMVIGPVGFCTDINSALFPYALVNGFYEGASRVWEMAIESRNASAACLYNDLIMPIAQYGNRRTQFNAQNVRWVVYGQDCGSKRYKSTYIANKKHLQNMKGIWRLINENTHELKPITGSETELIGTTIKHRAVSKCDWNAFRNELCSYCVGQIHRCCVPFKPGDVNYNYVKGRNIGHIAAVNFGGQNSSVVLQRKHMSATSTASEFTLDLGAQAYVNTNDTGEYIGFHDDQRPVDRLKIRLPRKQVARLYDVKDGTGHTIKTSEVTKLEHFVVIDKDMPDGHNETPVIIGSKSRTGHLSQEAIKFIVEKGWEFDKNRDLVVDLEGWQLSTPFCKLPQIELSPPEFIQKIVDFFLGPSVTSKNNEIVMRRLDSYKNIDEAIDVFYHEISDKMTVHYSHISIMILSISVQDKDNGDFRLPYPRDSGRIVSESKLLNNGSGGMQMAYEEQHKILSNPASYVLHRRKSHPMDALLLMSDPPKHVA